MKIDSSSILVLPSVSGPDYAGAQAPTRGAEPNVADEFAALVAGDPVPLGVSVTFAAPVKRAETGVVQSDADANRQGRAFASSPVPSPMAGLPVDPAAAAVATDAPNESAKAVAPIDPKVKEQSRVTVPDTSGQPTANDPPAAPAEAARLLPSAEPGLVPQQLPAFALPIAPGAQPLWADRPSKVPASGRPNQEKVSQSQTTMPTIDKADATTKGRITLTRAKDGRAISGADAAAIAAASGVLGQVPAVSTHQSPAVFASHSNFANAAQVAPLRSTATIDDLGTAPDSAGWGADAARVWSTGAESLGEPRAQKTEPPPRAVANVGAPGGASNDTNAASSGQTVDRTEARQLPALPFWAVAWSPPTDGATAQVDVGAAPVKISPEVSDHSAPSTAEASLPAPVSTVVPTSSQGPIVSFDQAPLIGSVEATAARPPFAPVEAKATPVVTEGNGTDRATPPSSPPIAAVQPGAVAMAALVGGVATHYSVAERAKPDLVAGSPTAGAARKGADQLSAPNAPVTTGDASVAKATSAAGTLASSPVVETPPGPGAAQLGPAQAPPAVPQAAAGPGSGAQSHQTEMAPMPAMAAADAPDAARKDHSRHADAVGSDQQPSSGIPFAVSKDAPLAAAPVPSAGAVAAREIAHQAAASLAGDAKHTDSKQIEIALAPEELGHVRITMTGDAGAMTLTIHAERQDTLDLLRRNIDTLAQEFQSLGYANTSFSFGQWSGQSAHPKVPAPASQNATDFTVLPSASAQPAPRPWVPNGQGLDIRL